MKGCRPFRLEKPQRIPRGRTLGLFLLLEMATKNSKKNNQRTTVSDKIRWCRKITEEHELFIFDLKAKGGSLRAIAEALESSDFHLKVHHSSIDHYLKNRIEAYQNYLSDLKEVRLANAKCRLLDEQQIADKLKEKMIEIMGHAPILWQDLNLAALISQYVNLMDQIRADCGDKVKDKNGEQREQTVIQIINTIPGMFADGDSRSTNKEDTTTRSRFRLDRT